MSFGFRWVFFWRTLASSLEQRPHPIAWFSQQCVRRGAHPGGLCAGDRGHLPVRQEQRGRGRLGGRLPPHLLLLPRRCSPTGLCGGVSDAHMQLSPQKSFRLLQPGTALSRSSGETAAFCQDLCHVKLIICRRSLARFESRLSCNEWPPALKCSSLPSSFATAREGYRRFCITRINIAMSRKLWSGSHTGSVTSVCWSGRTHSDQWFCGFADVKQCFNGFRCCCVVPDLWIWRSMSVCVFRFRVYFSSKLNIVDACVVAVTLVVTMIYTFSDLSGASLIPRLPVKRDNV